VLIRVMLACFLRMMRGVQAMPMGDMRMMGGFFMISALMMRSGFAMMFGGVLVMFRGFGVMLRALMNRTHNVASFFN
jgi:hypothetical protein